MSTALDQIVLKPQEGDALVIDIRERLQEKRIVEARDLTERLQAVEIDAFKGQVHKVYLNGILAEYEARLDENLTPKDRKSAVKQLFENTFRPFVAGDAYDDLAQLVLNSKKDGKVNVLLMHALGEAVRKELGIQAGEDTDDLFRAFGERSFEVIKQSTPGLHTAMKLTPVPSMIEQFASVNRKYNDITDSLVLGRKRINGKEVYVWERSLKPEYLSWLIDECGFRVDLEQDQAFVGEMLRRELLMNGGAIEGVGRKIKKVQTKVYTLNELDGLKGMNATTDKVRESAETVVAQPTYAFSFLRRTSLSMPWTDTPTNIHERSEYIESKVFEYFEELFGDSVFSHQIVYTNREVARGVGKEELVSMFFEQAAAEDRRSEDLYRQLTALKGQVRATYQNFVRSAHGIVDTEISEALARARDSNDPEEIKNALEGFTDLINRRTQKYEQVTKQVDEYASAAELRRVVTHDLKAVPQQLEQLRLENGYATVRSALLKLESLVGEIIEGEEYYTDVLSNVVEKLRADENTELAQRVETRTPLYVQQGFSAIDHDEDMNDPLVLALAYVLDQEDGVDFVVENMFIPVIESKYISEEDVELYVGNDLITYVDVTHASRGIADHLEATVRKGLSKNLAGLMEQRDLSLQAKIDEAATGLQLKHGIEITYSIDDEISIYADDTLIKIAFNTWLDNFAEHAKNGELKKVTITAQRYDDGRVELYVQGTGAGLPNLLSVRRYDQRETISSDTLVDYLNKGIGFTTKDHGNEKGARRVYDLLELHGATISYAKNELGGLDSLITFNPKKE